MFAKIKPKRSTEAGIVPTIHELDDGELAVNLADRKIFARDGDQIVTLGEDVDLTQYYTRSEVNQKLLEEETLLDGGDLNAPPQEIEIVDGGTL